MSDLVCVTLLANKEGLDLTGLARDIAEPAIAQIGEEEVGAVLVDGVAAGWDGAWAWLGEVPNLWQVTGAVVIIAGVTLVRRAMG